MFITWKNKYVIGRETVATSLPVLTLQVPFPYYLLSRKTQTNFQWLSVLSPPRILRCDCGQARTIIQNFMFAWVLEKHKTVHNRSDEETARWTASPDCQSLKPPPVRCAESQGEALWGPKPSRDPLPRSQTIFCFSNLLFHGAQVTS